MAYIITAQLTFSSSTNRSNAQTRVNNAIGIYNFFNRDTLLTTGGVSGSGSILNISIQAASDDHNEVRDIAQAIYDAAVASNRHTSGFMSVNKVLT